jgi:hypothetical protein
MAVGLMLINVLKKLIIIKYSHSLSTRWPLLVLKPLRKLAALIPRYPAFHLKLHRPLSASAAQTSKT